MWLVSGSWTFEETHRCPKLNKRFDLRVICNQEAVGKGSEALEEIILEQVV